jgi:hypothetical protein
MASGNGPSFTTCLWGIFDRGGQSVRRAAAMSHCIALTGLLLAEGRRAAQAYEQWRDQRPPGSSRHHEQHEADRDHDDNQQQDPSPSATDPQRRRPLVETGEGGCFLPQQPWWDGPCRRAPRKPTSRSHPRGRDDRETCPHDVRPTVGRQRCARQEKHAARKQGERCVSTKPADAPPVRPYHLLPETNRPSHSHCHAHRERADTENAGEHGESKIRIARACHHQNLRATSPSAGRAPPG